MVFRRKVELGRDNAVDSYKHHPNYKRAWDGDDVVLGPVVRHQRGLAKNSQQDGAVHGCTPDPFSGGDAVALDTIVDPEEGAANVEQERVVDRVGDPGGKDALVEEAVALTKVVELGIAVKQAGGDKLVEDTKHEGREDRVKDVVEGEGPGFVNDFTREDVLERVLG